MKTKILGSIAIATIIGSSYPAYAQAPVAQHETQALSVDPKDITKRAFEQYSNSKLTLRKPQNAIQTLFDRTMSRNTDDFTSLISNAQYSHPSEVSLFESYSKIEKSSPQDVFDSPELASIRAKQSSNEWHVKFTSNFLEAVLLLRRNELEMGFTATNAALESIPTNIEATDTQNALFDVYELLQVAFVMDGSTEQTLKATVKLVELYETTERAVDPYTLVNNLAVLYGKDQNPALAIEIIKTTEPYLNLANEKQISLYYYSLGRFLIVNEQYQEGLDALNIVLSKNPPEHFRGYILAQVATATTQIGKQSDISDLINEIERIAELTDLNKDLTTALLRLKARHAENIGESSKALQYYKEWSEERLKISQQAVSTNREKTTARMVRSQTFLTLELDNAKYEASLKDEIILKEKAVASRTRMILWAAIMFFLMGIVMYIRENSNNKKLRLSRDQALAGTRAKTEFLATMSHEIRTPLNHILPIATMLKDQLKDPGHSTLITVVENASIRLLDMVENIMTITKGQGDYLPDLKKFSPEHTVFSQCVIFQKLAIRKGLKFNIDISNKIPHFLTMDEKGFKMVLEQLISNAVKFTKTGNVNITLDYDNKTQPYITLIVADTGIGMDVQKLATLKEPFTMVDQTIKRENEGAGIGLAIVDIVCGVNGATIDCKSDIESGTTWSIKFLLETDNEDKKPQSKLTDNLFEEQVRKLVA